MVDCFHDGWIKFEHALTGISIGENLLNKKIGNPPLPYGIAWGIEDKEFKTDLINKY